MFRACRGLCLRASFVARLRRARRYATVYSSALAMPPALAYAYESCWRFSRYSRAVYYLFYIHYFSAAALSPLPTAELTPWMLSQHGSFRVRRRALPVRHESERRWREYGIGDKMLH